MDRQTALWTLTVFFGATVAFGLVRNLSDGMGGAASFGLQVLTLAVIVGAVALVAKRR